MLRLAIVGGGIGGLASAVALTQAGHRVDVFEQAVAFRTVGTGITLSPNAVRVLDSLDLGSEIRGRAHRPPNRVNREWDTGETTSVVELGATAEQKYGAPLLCMHRADLLSALMGAVGTQSVHLGKRLVGIDAGADVKLIFADGEVLSADGLIGADGIHSSVRKLLLGEDEPRFRGIVAYRTVVPVSQLSKVEVGPFIKWWSNQPEREVVAVPIGGERMYAQVTSPSEEWVQESWSMKDNGDGAREAVSGFHEAAREMFDVSGEVLVSALYDRDPIASWAQEHIALLGDACHPMLPFMGQGAAMALEDAAVLARCLLGDPDDVPEAFREYERARRARVERVQSLSRLNVWGKQPPDVEWVYGYDATDG